MGMRNLFIHHGSNSNSSSHNGDDPGDYGYGGGGSSSASNGNYVAPPTTNLLLGDSSDSDTNSHFVRGIVIIVIVVLVLTTAYVVLVLINRFCCCCCPTWLKPSEFFLAELSIHAEQQGDSSDDESSIQVDDVEAGYLTTRSREANVQSSNSTRRDNDASSGIANNNPPSLLPLDVPSTTRRSTTIASLRRRDYPNYDLTFQSLSLVDLNQLEFYNRITLAQIQATQSLRIDHHRNSNNNNTDDDDEWQPPFFFSSLTLFERKTLLQFVLGKSVYIHPKPQPHPQDDNISHVNQDHRDKKQPKTKDTYSAEEVDGGAASHADSTPSLSASTEQTSHENPQKDSKQTSQQEHDETENEQNDDSKIEEPERQANSNDGIELKECIKDDTASTIIDDDDEEEKSCGICLGEYDPGVPILSSPHCQHSFHYHCIMDWLSRAKQSQFEDYFHHTNAISLSSCCCCPFCRRQIVTLPELCDAAQQVMNPNRLLQLGILPKVYRKSRMATTATTRTTPSSSSTLTSETATRTPIITSTASPPTVPPPSITTTTTAASTSASSS